MIALVSMASSLQESHSRNREKKLNVHKSYIERLERRDSDEVIKSREGIPIPHLSVMKEYNLPSHDH